MFYPSPNPPPLYYFVVAPYISRTQADHKSKTLGTPDSTGVPFVFGHSRPPPSINHKPAITRISPYFPQKSPKCFTRARTGVKHKH